METIKTSGTSYNSGPADWLTINSKIPSIITSKPTGILTFNNNNIMQNKVAIFKVTRNKNEEIISSKFIKELWIESKNGKSIDFEVAKDPEISKYEANEIVIKNVHIVTF